MRTKGRNRLLAWMLLLAMVVADLPVLPGGSNVEVEAAEVYPTGIRIGDTDIPVFDPTITEYTMVVPTTKIDSVGVTVTPAGINPDVTKSADKKTITVEAGSGTYTIKCVEGPKSDEFDSPTATNDIWKVHDGDNQRKQENGYLQINSQKGSFYGSASSAKNVLYQPAYGDWESVTHVKYEGDFTANNQAIGVMLAEATEDGELNPDSYLWFRYEYINYSGFDSSSKKTSIRVNREMLSGLENTPKHEIVDIANYHDETFISELSSKNELYFKVKKVCDLYTFSVSVDGNSFTDIATTKMTFENPMFALAAHNSDTTESVTAKFQSVTFTELKNEAKPFVVKRQNDENNCNRLYLASEPSYLKNFRAMYEASNPNDYLALLRTYSDVNGWAYYNINVERAGWYKVKLATSRTSDSNTNLRVLFDSEIQKNVAAKQPNKTSGDYVFENAFERSIWLDQGIHSVKILVTSGGISRLAYLDFESCYSFMELEAEAGEPSGAIRLAERTITNENPVGNGCFRTYVGGYGDGKTTFKVNVEEGYAGLRTVKLYYATKALRDFCIEVNERKYVLSGENTSADYFTLTDEPLVAEIELEEGENIISIGGNYPKDAPNFDRLQIELTKDEATSAVQYMVRSLPIVIDDDNHSITDENGENVKNDKTTRVYFDAVKHVIDKDFVDAYGEKCNLGTEASTILGQKQAMRDSVGKNTQEQIQGVYDNLIAKVKSLNAADYVNFNLVESVYQLATQAYKNKNYTLCRLRLVELESLLDELILKEEFEGYADKYQELESIIKPLIVEHELYSKKLYVKDGSTELYDSMYKAFRWNEIKDHNNVKSYYDAEHLYAKAKSNPVTIKKDEMLVLGKILTSLDPATKEVLNLRFEKLQAIKEQIVADRFSEYEEGDMSDLTTHYTTAKQCYQSPNCSAETMNDALRALENTIRSLLKARYEHFSDEQDNMEATGYYTENSVSTLGTQRDTTKTVVNTETSNVFKMADAVDAYEAAFNKLVKNTYNVTFKKGYVDENYSVVPVEAGNAVETPPNPTREDYKFAGWYTNSGDKYGFHTVVKEAVTLTAKWYATVTLDAGEGFFTNGAQKIEKEIFENSKIGEVESPSREDYVFQGWKIGEVNYNNLSDYVVTENVTFTAKWEEANKETLKAQVENLTFPENTDGKYTTDSYKIQESKFNTKKKTDCSEMDAIALSELIRELESIIAQLVTDAEVNALIARYNTASERFNDIKYELYTENSYQELKDKKEAAYGAFLPDAKSIDVESVTYDKKIELQEAIAAFETAFTYLEYKTFTVSLDAKNNETIQTQVVKINEYATKPEDPSRGDYIFDGWYKTGESATFKFEETPITENTSIIAKWIATVTFVSTGSESKSLQVFENEKLTVEQLTEVAPKRDGYTFVGWFDEDGNEFNYEERTITENITLTARWNVTVSFNTNGGDRVEDVTILENETIVKPTTQRTDYSFKDWYLDDEVFDFSQPITKSIELEAKWTVDVTYDLNGGVLENVEGNSYTEAIVENSKLAQPQVNPTKEGYTFAGWYVGEEKEDGSIAATDTKFTFSETVAKNLILVARWNVEVTFDLGDIGKELEEDAAYQTQTILADTIPTKPSVAPQVSGYAFKGWFNGESEYTFEEPLTCDTTLKAKWVKTYVVTFDSAGGTTVRTQMVERGGRITKPENPTKPGYTFGFWYVNLDDSENQETEIETVAEIPTEYDFSTPVKSAVHLVVYWKISDLQAEKDAFDELAKNENYPALDNEIVKNYYTLASWKPYEEAYSKLKALYEQENVAMETFVAAKNDVIEKKASLLLKETVGKVYSEYYKYVLDELPKDEDEVLYTPETWNAYITVETKAKTSFGNVETDYNNVDKTMYAQLLEDLQLLKDKKDLLVKKQCTVTFKSEGVVFGEPQVLTAGELVIAPEKSPEKVGYIFKGWCIEGTDTIYVFETTKVTDDLVLAAAWTVTSVQAAQDAFAKVEDKWEGLQQNKGDYTDESWKAVEDAYNAAKAEANKGQNANAETLDSLVGNLETAITNLKKKVFTVTFLSDGTLYGTVQIITIHEKATAPTAPSKAGQTFKGWFAEGATQAYNFNTPVTANLVLTAKWDITTLQTAKDSFAEAEDAWNSLQSSKDKYTEESWKEAEDAYKAAAEEAAKENPDAETLQGLVDVLNKEMGDLVENTANAATYTVTFMANGAQHGEVQTITEGKKATAPAAPEKENYTFKGWYAEGATEAYNFDTPVTADLILTAKWTFASLQAAQDEFKKYQDLYPTLDRNLYTEESWKAFEDAYYAVQEELAKGEGADLDKLADLMNRLEDAYNHLVRTAYVVFFMVDGVPYGDMLTVLPNEVVSAPEAPVKAGYIFRNWYAQGAEEAYDFATPVNTDLVLNAKWTFESLLAAQEAFKKYETMMQTLNKDNYTPESWQAFENAYLAAWEELSKGEGADLSKLADLFEQLEAAANGLVLTAEAQRVLLEEALNVFRDLESRIPTLNPDDYTPESWQALMDAYNAAKAEADKGEFANLDAMRALNDAFNFALLNLQLKIIPAPVSSIKITGISKQIAAGKKVQLTANISPENAANKGVIWTSSNKKYATVNAKGLVKTKKAGKNKKVTITATAADGSGVVAKYKIKIMQLAVKQVKIKAGSKTVKVGKSIKLVSSVTPKASKKKINAKLQWTSSNTKYATVNAKGVVKTKKAGKNKTVKITAKATDGSNKKAVFKVKITK